MKDTSMERTTTPLPNPAVVARELDGGEAVLVNLDTAASLALNPTGLLVWTLTDGQRTAAEIIAAVRNHFRNVPDSVDDDILTLLEILADGGFVGFPWTSE